MVFKKGEIVLRLLNVEFECVSLHDYYNNVDLLTFWCITITHTCTNYITV